MNASNSPVGQGLKQTFVMWGHSEPALIEKEGGRCKAGVYLGKNKPENSISKRIWVMKRTALLILLVFVFGNFQAQNNQKGPQQGVVKTDKNCKIEFLGCMDHLEIYLYDSSFQAMNNSDITGQVQFYHNDKTITTAPLVPYGKEGFTAKLPVKAYKECLVRLEIRKTILSAKFVNECVIAQTK